MTRQPTDRKRALDALQQSTEHLGATLQTLVDPLVLLTAARDADGTVVDFVCAFASDAACAVGDVTREDLVGRRLLEFLPEARTLGLFDAFVRVVETGEPFVGDDLVVAAGWDGEETERRLNVRVARVGDQVAITWIDATERRRIEAQLGASEQRFDAALGSMLDSVTIVSPVRGDDGEIVDFRYEYVNDAHCALVGFDRDQLLGHRIGELFPEYPGSDRFELYRRVAVSGEPCRTDEVRQEEAWAGTPLAARVLDTMIVSVGENLVVSARDVTERRRNEQALQLQAELLDLAHDAVIVRDPTESRVTFWNREAQAIYGYSAAEALGQVTHELLATIFPESRQAVEDALAREGQWVGELHHTRKDGGVIVVSSRQALQRAADGRPSAIIELNSDVTEHKRVEVELRMLAAGVDSSADAIFSKDRDCRITSWNRGAERLYGYTASEIVGQPVSVLVPADRAGEEQAILDRALRGEDVGRYETRRVAQDGTVIDVSITVSPIYGTSGDIIGASSIHRDITERKLAEAEVRRLNAELERRVLQRTAELKAANQELEGFAYSLAHDLRAPIRAINGFGAALSESRGDELGDQGRETLDRIRRAGAKMGELIDAMLLLSDLTRRELTLTSVDLSAMAREISEDLRALEPTRGVEFVIEDGLETAGDKRLVRVLMRNLLENAWKFTSPREHARIEVKRAGPGVFAVTDNGVGFNMDFAGLLFEPFARLHREDEFPGIGVGLTTVQRIVRRHGGAVWGEGRPGEGATIYFKLEPPTETG